MTNRVSAQPALPRILSLRYDGTCSSCATPLERRSRAWWFKDERKIVCLRCRPEQSSLSRADDPAPNESGEALIASKPPSIEQTVEVPPPLIRDGEAGASARREGARRRANRERKTLARHPHAGKLILAVSDEPQHIRAWSRGAVGEDALGARLNQQASERLVVLHDRRIPRSRANIDHIAVTPNGVFVIDTKHYSGRLQKRDLGGLFRTDLRLYVGRRDCTKLAHSAEDQAEIVREALAPLAVSGISVLPVLCFIGVELGLFQSPFQFGSVLVTWPKALYPELQKDREVETSVIQDTARHLAAALPRAAS